MITKDNIQFGNTRIDYEIIYSNRRKNATLAVYPMKQVEITVPENIAREHIRRFVRNKAAWITKQIIWFDDIAGFDSEKEYVNGETFLYLGRQYRLKIIRAHGHAKADIEGKNLVVNIPLKTAQNSVNKMVKAAIWHWYRLTSNDLVELAVKAYSKKLGIRPPAFFIKNQVKRWGSCTSKKQLIFNFRIAMASKSQLDYIVAHELCHVKIKDHTPAFWALLGSILPDYEVRKEALRNDGWNYVL